MLIADFIRGSFSRLWPIDCSTSPSLPAIAASGLRAARIIASRPFCHSVSSHSDTDLLSSSSSFIASTRSRVSGLVCRSLARSASACSILIRTGWAGSVCMSAVSLRRPSTIASASLASSPASFSTQLARLWTMSRIRPSLASSARAVQRIAASSIGTWRSSLIALASAWPSSGETSILRIRLAIELLTSPPSRSSSRLSNRSAISRLAPWRMRVSWPCGAWRKRPTAPARSMLRIRRATTGAIRKFSLRKLASASPIRSLLRGMIAVCGIGRPSGWRNRAVTANQSARPPTIAASAKALT